MGEVHMMGIQGLSAEKETGTTLSVYSKAYVPFSLGLGFIKCFNCQIVLHKTPFAQSLWAHKACFETPSVTFKTLFQLTRTSLARLRFVYIKIV